jgi:hypothetical protein
LSRRSETIEVEVSQRVLWIGAGAYPLQNIARIQKMRLAPQRRAAFMRFLVSTIVWISLGVFAWLALGITPTLGIDSLPPLPVGSDIRTGVVTVVLALTMISSIRLIRTLLEKTLYALVIETAGNPHTALVASDGSQIASLARAILKAINNPQEEFRTLVQNIHAGDRIQQFGSYNVGKVSP